MPAGSQPFVRAADPADAGQVAAIFAHYVTTSVATFEEVTPAAADGDAAVCGFAYASPWRVIAVIAVTGSDASAALHRRLGFADVGKLPKVGFKFGRWVDTALMQKDLGPKGVTR
jgi:L-amino acid N-acyltransferase YncA